MRYFCCKAEQGAYVLVRRTQLLQTPKVEPSLAAATEGEGETHPTSTEWDTERLPSHTLSIRPVRNALRYSPRQLCLSHIPFPYLGFRFLHSCTGRSGCDRRDSFRDGSRAGGCFRRGCARGGVSLGGDGGSIAWGFGSGR